MIGINEFSYLMFSLVEFLFDLFLWFRFRYLYIVYLVIVVCFWKRVFGRFLVLRNSWEFSIYGIFAWMGFF